MILPEADFEICIKDSGMCFNSEKVNLDKDSLVFPISYNGTVGTIAFHRSYVIINPANGESKKLTTEQFVQMCENLNGSE